MAKETTEMKVGEQISAIETIVRCPECKHESNGSDWGSRRGFMFCPSCKARIPTDNVIIVSQIKTTLERLS
jgi:transcription elongation factor Elf1